jgi:hypothetical protein
MTDTRALPRYPEMMRRAAAFIEEGGDTYDDLAAGPLGEALTRAEIEELVGDRQAINELAAAMRETADWWEERHGVA